MATEAMENWNSRVFEKVYRFNVSNIVSHPLAPEQCAGFAPPPRMNKKKSSSSAIQTHLQTKLKLETHLICIPCAFYTQNWGW